MIVTLTEAILLRAGWTPRQLNMKEAPPPAELSSKPLSIHGVIDTRPGRCYGSDAKRASQLRRYQRRKAGG